MSYALETCTVPLAMHIETLKIGKHYPTSENKGKLIIILLSWPFISYLPLKIHTLFKPINLRRYRCISDICLLLVWKAGKSQLGARNTAGFLVSKGIARQRAFFYLRCNSYGRRPDTRFSFKKNTFIHIEGARIKKTKKARGRQRPQTRESSCWSRVLPSF